MIWWSQRLLLTRIINPENKDESKKPYLLCLWRKKKLIINFRFKITKYIFLNILLCHVAKNITADEHPLS